jgi:hypothetical protein
MDNTWRQTYAELTNFVAELPAIKIDLKNVSLPGDIRPEFYKLFDSVRVSFVKECFSSQLENAYELCRDFNGIAGSIKNDMKLESIEVTTAAKWFMIDPLNGLMRVLFDPLFDLLKGKIEVEVFEKIAIGALSYHFKGFYHEGYKYWAMLGLMKVMAPDKLWRGQVVAVPHDIRPTGASEANVPEPVEARQLVFSREPDNSFLVPKAVVFSSRAGAFVSIAPDFYQASFRAKKLNAKMEWLSVGEIEQKANTVKKWPDMAVYVSEHLEDLSLIADCKSMARPDILVEFLDEGGWNDSGWIESIKRTREVLTPRFESFVISRTEVPAEVREQIVSSGDIKFISAGYDTASLEPMVSALARIAASRKEAEKNKLDTGDKNGG